MIKLFTMTFNPKKPVERKFLKRALGSKTYLFECSFVSFDITLIILI